MNGYWNMGCFRKDSEYGVFDDMDFNTFKYFKQFMGSQAEFTASDKYVRNCIIRFGKPCIWLCNESMDIWKLDDSMQDWISRNCDVVYVDEYMY